MIRLDVPDVRAAVYSAWDGDPDVMGPAFQEWLTGVRRDAVRDALHELLAAIDRPQP